MNAYCVQYTHKTFIQPVHDACRAAGGAVNTPNIINNSVNSKNVGMHISIHSEPIIIIIKISSTNKVWNRRRKNRCCHSVLSLFDVTAFEPNRWCVCVAQMNALYAHNKIGVDLIDFFSLFFARFSFHSDAFQICWHLTRSHHFTILHFDLCHPKRTHAAQTRHPFDSQT